MKFLTITYLIIVLFIHNVFLLNLQNQKLKKSISLSATEELSTIAILNSDFYTSSYENNLDSKNNESEEKIDSIRIELKKIDTNTNNNFVSLDNSNKNLKKVTLDSASENKLVNLKNYKNTQYIAILNVGSPEQQIPVILDSGSGNLFINSSKCKKDSCSSHVQYDSLKSSSYKSLGLKVEVKFGSGQIIGEINEEKVSLAGLAVDNQRIGEIVDEKGDVFSEGYFSGILGFGFSSMSAYNSTTYFENIKNLGLLKRNLLSFYYSIDENKSGEVMIGNVNKEKFVDKINYFKVTEKYYWTISLKDILYNNQSLGLCEKGCKAIIDTGTSLITGPTKDVDKLLNILPIQSNCKNYDITQDLTFIFENEEGTFEYSLEKNTYIQKNENDCRSLIVPLDLNNEHGPAWVFGNIFMKKYYTIFDLDNNSVGFSLAKH